MSALDHLRLRRGVRALLAPWDGAVPGMSVGVVQDDALVLHESAGLASLELAVPIGPETCFRIASVSKPSLTERWARTVSARHPSSGGEKAPPAATARILSYAPWS